MLANIELLLNKFLLLDTKSTVRLNALENKILFLTITDLPSLSFYLKFTDKKIILSKTEAHPADVKVCGPLKAFIALARFKDPMQAARLGLTFEGSLSISEAIRDLFFSMDIDWEEHLSHYTGDSVAHAVGSLFQKAKNRKDKILQHLTLSTAEYLQEESQDLPFKEDVLQFFTDVDELRSDVDRLEARFFTLQKKIKSLQEKVA